MDQSETKSILIDCDPGIDDAIALMVAFAWRDRLDIKGITCAAGNQTVLKTFHNALRIARHLNVEVPVACGAEKPLIKPLAVAEKANGKTGLEGMNITEDMIRPNKMSAFDLISKILEGSEKKITIIATAPLTNIAQVLSVRPQLKTKIDHISLMGGSSLAGNMTPVSEFNMFVDPEAAKIVLGSGVPITMFGLDVTYKAYTTRQDIQHIAILENRASRMLEDLLHYYMGYSEKMGLDGVAIHDACTVIYELKPELFSGIQRVSVDIDTGGGQCYGCTLVDLHHLTGRPENVDFVTQVDRTAFNDFIFDSCSHYRN
ncbi:nucleoside hydrolase [Sporolactobacillus pectinivorans]|uniref:nucleoside hydrolase n=1 Tax=Sporolactobacillus pectinivorans TaxID=1591408 RepID=UPI0012FD8E98|nr:nucleoside hydrolase [Sporolactobacillus pectinivorans]